jgi:hypothetical protein
MSMSEDQTSGEPSESEALGAARERRSELKHAMSALELAAAGAAGDPAWIDALREALAEVRVVFDAHVEEVEASDGLLAELVAEAPRLSNRVNRLHDEHPELSQRIDACVALLEEGDPHEIRGEVLDLLVALARHRHAGADLVYEAYNVDIGGQS